MSFSPFNPFTQPPPRRPQQRPTAGVKQKNPKDAGKEKHGQVLRFLFNPELGQGFESLHQTHGMFLRLIANVFLQTGLIDATYEGLRDPQKLKLVTLIETAYHGLEYTRLGMPRVLLFASFVGSLFAVALSILIFALSLFSTTPAPSAPAAGQPAAPAIQNRVR
jgi:hypothetical protein